MAGRPKKLVLHWPVQHRQQAAAASNIHGRGVQATKTRQAMMLRDSKDVRVRQADIEVRTGRKWSASRALREAEDRLQHADIVRSVAQGRLGLGCSTRVSWVKANPKEKQIKKVN